MYWALVMVNFTCQFDCGRDAQIAGKILFLGVPRRMFSEDISICLENVKISLSDVCGHRSIHEVPA